MENFKSKILKNPYLLFSPFLLTYIIIAIVFHQDAYVGDEIRYVTLAKYILNFDFSITHEISMLTNGPGYPLLIAPIVGLQLPKISFAILNAILLYFSIVLVFKSLTQIVDIKMSIWISLFWAFFYNSYELISLVLPEIFTVFLISFLIYWLVKTFQVNDTKKNRSNLYISGLTLGYIGLTKFIFGYVLLVLFIGSFVLWLSDKESKNYKKGIIIVLIAFFFNLPYLIYSYSVSNSFKWGGIGGNNMYWMSTPYSDEYGDWYDFNDFNKMDKLNTNKMISAADSSRFSHHFEVFMQISKDAGIKSDQKLKEITLTNIKKHPLKYLQNCISNLGRIVFNFPYSHTLQRPGTLLRLPQNGIICVFLLYSLIPTFISWRKISYAIRFLILFSVIYLGGSVFACGETRMFTIIVPVLLIWIAFILQNTVQISLKFKEK